MDRRPVAGAGRFTSFQQSLNTLHLPEDPSDIALEEAFRGAGSHMTGFWPDNWHSPLFARKHGGFSGRPLEGTGRIVEIMRHLPLC